MPWPKTEPPKEEEFQPADFLFSFEEFIFEDYGNTSNNFKQKRRPIPATPNCNIPPPRGRARLHLAAL